jgi:hypothetical protein
MRQRPDDGIQNLIEALANIFAQKPQHMISVLLEQAVLTHFGNLHKTGSTVAHETFLEYGARQMAEVRAARPRA